MTDATEGAEENAEDKAVLALFARLPDAAAREELIVRFQPLAEYLARRFGGRGQPMEDLVQVAYVGLISAVDRFDLAREVRFSTYAAATIIGELKRHLRDKAWAVRVPRSLQELGLRINRSLPVLTQELGRSPTVQELADRLDSTPEEILGAMDAAQAYTASSLDAPLTQGSVAPHEILGEEDPSLELLDEWATIAPAVKGLPDRERKVLYLRFFAGMTQSQIAEKVGVSQMHVSRILSQVLAQLRRDAGAWDRPRV
jgi:RNA polymerase sigma-B factor